MDALKSAGSVTQGLAALAALFMVGCATPPPADDKEAQAEFAAVNDPLEPMNRAIFGFNEVVDRNVLKPVAEGYREVVPGFGRDRVHDFLGNLRAPLTAIHDVLQGDIENFGVTVARFGLNSTFGVLGIMDVASEMGLRRKEEDGGQTFGVWGIPEGPYLVIPLLGPSNPRDAVGYVVDWVIDPFNIYTNGTNEHWAQYSRTGTSVVDQREKLLDPLNEIQKSSLDYYAAIRSLYRQRRDALIRNSNKSDGAPAPGMTGRAPGAEQAKDEQAKE